MQDSSGFFLSNRGSLSSPNSGVKVFNHGERSPELIVKSIGVSEHSTGTGHILR